MQGEGAAFVSARRVRAAKPRRTMQAASRGDAGQDSAWFWKIPLIQSSNAPLRRPCRQLPLQVSLSSGSGFKCLPCKGSWMRRRRRRRGAAPVPASILPDRRTSPAPASIQRLALVRNRRVRTFQAPRDGAGSVQRGCRARLCRILEDTPDAKRQCPPSGGLAASSPYRGAFPAAAASNASPVRGGGCAAGADGGVPHLALQVSFRAAAHPRPPARIISIPLPCLSLPPQHEKCPP